MKNKHLTEEELIFFLDNELDNKERKIVEEHIKECSICQNKLNEIKAIEESLKSPVLLEPPPNLVSNIMERLMVRKGMRVEELFISLFVAFSSISAILVYLIYTKGIKTLVNIFFKKADLSYFIKNGESNFKEILFVIKKLIHIILVTPISKLSDYISTFRIAEFILLTIVLIAVGLWKKEVLLKRKG